MAICTEHGVLPEALGALIGIAIEVLVHPLEVKRQRERLSHLHIRKDMAAGVEDKAEHAGGQLRCGRFADHIPRVNGGKIVGARPMVDIEIGVDINVTLLERLKQCTFLKEIGDADFIVIVETDLGWDVLAPIIRITRIGDSLSGRISLIL